MSDPTAASAPDTSITNATNAAPAADAGASTAPTAASTPAATPVGSGATGTTPAPDASSTAAGTDAATQQAIEEMIQAQYDGKPLPLSPKTMIPWKRGKESGFHPLSEVMQSGMLRRDYDRRLHEHRQQVDAFEARERQHAEKEIALKAREDFVEKERQRYIEAQTSPEKWEAYQRHLDMLQNDKNYAETWKRAQDAYVHEAVDAHHEEVARQEYVHGVIEEAGEYIDQLAERYPGVDPKRITRLYVAELTERGQAALNTQTVRALYEQEAKALTAAAAPMKAELDDLRKQIAALQAQLSVDANNAKVLSGIDRAKKPAIGAPAGNAPSPHVKDPVAPYPASKRDEVTARWVRGG